MGLFWGAPLIAGLAFSLAAVFDPAAWGAVFGHPQLGKALLLSVYTGSAALVLSLVFALTIVAGLYQSRYWRLLSQANGVFLAIPHLAFAIGLGFLIMPSGWITRLLAQAITGWSVPPAWITTQDPFGISLTTALVCKETPFLIWSVWSLLARGDTAQMLHGQWRSARSLGHAPGSIWVRLFIPQIITRIAWPAVIVWVYGATVVDMALVIGPTQPPAYAVIAWADLNDAEISINARGAAGALLLTALLVAIGASVLGLSRLARRPLRGFMTMGPSMATGGKHVPLAIAMLGALGLIYVLVVAVLMVMSAAAHWPFPHLLPDGAQWRSWNMLLSAPEPLLNSLWLAFLSTASALGLAILWFETMARRDDHLLVLLAAAALTIPQITLVGGQYAVFLRADLTGTAAGVFLAHLTPVLAYVLVVLQGPYRTFDRRLRSVSLGLNCSAWRFWSAIKAPLMMPALSAAAAVGFAVSMAQFLPAQLIGSGRITTLPVEAVTLASGGNRALQAVYALALTIPPALGFLLAQRLGHPRWSRA